MLSIPKECLSALIFWGQPHLVRSLPWFLCLSTRTDSSGKDTYTQEQQHLQIILASSCPNRPFLELRWSSSLLPPISLTVTMEVKTHGLLALTLSAVIGWVPEILWPGSLSHHQVEAMGWVDRASRGTNEGPEHDAGCPALRGCRVCGLSTTPWWSVPEASGRDGRRKRRKQAGSPLHMCLRWRQRQKHVLRLGLQREGTMMTSVPPSIWPTFFLTDQCLTRAVYQEK